MHVENRKLSEIVPYARNPRKNAQAVSAVAGSLKEFGPQQPIVVDNEGVIVVGHTRLLAAQQLGMEAFPVAVASELTPQQVKAYRLADNKAAERAEWDIGLLKLELDDLLADGVDLDLTGFEQVELDDILAPNPTEGLTDPDDVPDLPDEAVSVAGDVWVLGRHRLMCGDSTSEEDVQKLLAGVQPHLMVTDPPWGVEYDASWRVIVHSKDSVRAEGKVVNDDQADWKTAWLLFPGDVAYCWHAGIKTKEIYDSFLESGFVIKSQIVWAKSQFAIGRGHYHLQHESCIYATKKGKAASWQGSRKESTLWNIQKPLKSETGHSTQKPVECMRRPIENNSSPGQAVYEPFSGSGTTIIAAEQTGRACYAMEVHPPYVDMAVRRWQEFTGENAVLERTGESFSG